ncbi:MAG: hypothetical protein LBV72_00705 [Tannerella sp.]|jgi:hypothetical protein|nr:hypothetical protein [Tannerella sp.]
MYQFKFLEYNQLTKEIMSEEDTLDNIVSIALNGKPTKEDKKHLLSCEEWAKYAFDNNDIYYVTMYKYERPVASIRVTDMHITILFLEQYGGELVNYLTLVYHRFDLLKYIDKNEIEYFNETNLFLGEILSYNFDDEKKSNTNIAFSINGFAVVSMTQATSPENDDWNTVKKKVEVNISHNFIRPPKNYKDFEYLLDYQNNIKPEYFDLPNQVNN